MVYIIKDLKKKQAFEKLRERIYENAGVFEPKQTSDEGVKTLSKQEVEAFLNMPRLQDNKETLEALQKGMTGHKLTVYDPITGEFKEVK